MIKMKLLIITKAMNLINTLVISVLIINNLIIKNLYKFNYLLKYANLTNINETIYLIGQRFMTFNLAPISNYE